MANSFLVEINEQLAEGKSPSVTVREFLQRFNAYRRRVGVVERIRVELEDQQLVTKPDFESTWIDGYISFEKASPVLSDVSVDSSQEIAEVIEETSLPIIAEEDRREAGFRVGKLSAANRAVISVNPDASISEATTIMLANDFSQLPVMTSERKLLGVISWKSIGLRLSQNKSIETVRSAMDRAIEIKDTDTIFDATREIIKHDFVLVRASDNRISGIITATDLSEQFQRLSEPFLLLSEIENHVRNMINGVFTVDMLKSACNDSDGERKSSVQYVSDLTFGEYIRLLQKPENWEKIHFKGDRKTFCDHLEAVREIRNDVMHFDPDGIDEAQEEALRKFSRFMSEIDRISGK